MPVCFNSQSVSSAQRLTAEDVPVLIKQIEKNTVTTQTAD
jgi:hypothetical protein